MNEMDALYKYWEDPDYIIVKAGQPEPIIEWLSGQTPETWHRVVMTWNYDYEDAVLSWILQQKTCDRGTAARVFEVEGLGHWLGDAKLATNKKHLCSIVLANWSSYETGMFRHESEYEGALLDRVQKHLGDGLYVDTPILEVARYSGSKDAVSQYASEDGKIVIAFDHWLKTKGIEITE